MCNRSDLKSALIIISHLKKNVSKNIHLIGDNWIIKKDSFKIHIGDSSKLISMLYSGILFNKNPKCA